MTLAIEVGWGYWDTTHYPYGGDFRRATENLRVAEVLDKVNSHESRVKLCDGRTAVVKTQALIPISAPERD